MGIKRKAIELVNFVVVIGGTRDSRPDGFYGEMDT
jgi:hypothetical protein